MRSLIAISISGYRKLEIYQYSSRYIESVLFTLFSPYLRYYQPIFPTTQSGARGYFQTRWVHTSSTFAVPPLRLHRSGEIPLVCHSARSKSSVHTTSSTISSRDHRNLVDTRNDCPSAPDRRSRWVDKQHL
jgi:hypothetical protein